VARPLTDRETLWSFEVRTDRNPGAVARRQLDSLADHVDPATLARLRLLVSELVNRAVTTLDRSSVQVSVIASGRCVRATVGSGAENESPVLDWALFLVRRMADRWGIASGVWFELDRPQRDI
jgi:hypothetical protein